MITYICILSTVLMGFILGNPALALAGIVLLCASTLDALL